MRSMKIPIRINIRIEKKKYMFEWCGKDRKNGITGEENKR